MANEQILIPMIMQHVRDLAGSHLASADKQRFKVVTPFPPGLNDFPDFQREQLEFGDPQGDGAAAAADTNYAFDFFRNSDALYYDYSYGIRVEEPTLSKICASFYLRAVFKNPDDVSFVPAFKENKDAFEKRFQRSTSGDLGQNPFVYTSYSPIRWNDNKVVVATDELKRLKEKTVAVYANPVLSSDYINSLIAGVYGSPFTKIEYEVGFFDVVRQWIDPMLFEHPNWTLNGSGDSLYGADEPVFESSDIRLCYAHRFYLIRNYSSDSTPDLSGSPAPVIRDHRRHRVEPDPREQERDALLGQTLSRLTPAVEVTTAGPATERPGFIFVPATATVPGHWEGVRRNSQPQTPRYRVAAVVCRVIPRKPVS